ncbi:hypothetical protein FACS1894186_1620 [Alphaproteobacteria bacterium]|nr:hypothetical protein FACS1894186_1620 [Alphaproteobacteria bacterium]
MAINIGVLADTPQQITCARIAIVGVGGAGGNAVNNMVETGVIGVDFIAANTDAQDLERSLAQNRLQLGLNTTRGLGAGADPAKGREAAMESMDRIIDAISSYNMVFVVAGMGGGTGTGAAPIIAKAAKDLGILTVGVITKPFMFERAHRMEAALAGAREMGGATDSLITISNQNLMAVLDRKATFQQAFKLVDKVLSDGVRSITDLVFNPGYINVDFADLCTVMRDAGPTIIGTGEARGENRATEAALQAINNPLLDVRSLAGAKKVLVNVVGNPDNLTLFEVQDAVDTITRDGETDGVDVKANTISGSCFDSGLEDSIRVAVVATGLDISASQVDRTRRPPVAHIPAPRPPVAAPEPVVEAVSVLEATAQAANFIARRYDRLDPRLTARVASVDPSVFVPRHPIAPDATDQEMLAIADDETAENEAYQAEPRADTGRFAMSPTPPIAVRSGSLAGKPPRRKAVRTTLFPDQDKIVATPMLTLDFDRSQDGHAVLVEEGAADLEPLPEFLVKGLG